jgi:hypothetical protein
MKFKSLITVVLIVFVAASLVYLVVKESGTESGEAEEIQTSVEQPAHKVVAYYFHGFKRCKTCLKIESSAKTAIEAAFEKEMSAGELEWKLVNFEEEANAEIVTKYELVASSLVIVEFQNGQEIRWKNLENVWELVWEDELYADYVTKEVTGFLVSDVNDG